ncbi:MAG: DUF3298 domain-containing protein [Bacteroidales bacterium]|nr:DUF3298 domain-containing protein [Bacteroidales bacterium]
MGYGKSFPGVIQASRQAVNQNGSTFQATLAVRCPNEPGLLKWLAGRVQKYVTDWPAGYNRPGTDPVAEKEFRNTRELVDYYMGILEDALKDAGNEDFPATTHQTGLLLADCWQKGELCTFYESVWDNESHLSRDGYITVNAKTGKAMRLEDLVSQKDFDALSSLLMPRLENAHGVRLLDQNYGYTTDNKTVLRQLSGCAMIREGLIIYFNPYILGSGADGSYKAVIPYEYVPLATE